MVGPSRLVLEKNILDLVYIHPAPFFNCLAQCGDFGQPEGGPISYMKNWSAGQLKLEGWGGVAYFWTSTRQVYLVGLIQLTILSGQGHFSELVVQTGEILFHCD